MINAAFTWNLAAFRLQTAKRHLLASRGDNKSDGTAGRQNEAHMTVCCYGDFLFCTKNRMKSVELLGVYYFLLTMY